MSTKTAIIVAKAADHGIGCSDGLPWHISEELQYFKKLTSGKPVIMGRKTYQSIVQQLGTSLPNRKNIVVSGSGYRAKDQDALVTSNLEEAIAQAKKVATLSGVDEIFIIGGENIFKQAIPQADTIYLTRIDMKCEHRTANAWLADDHFQSNSWDIVREEIRNLEEKLSQKIVKCNFQVLEKKSAQYSRA